LKVFPQCTDTLKKSSTGVFVPHFSIAKFRSEKELVNHEFYIKNKSGWKGLEFEVKELYFLSRPGGDPFEVRGVVPLGPSPSTPFFGPHSVPLDLEHERVARTLVIAGLPAQSQLSDPELLELFAQANKESQPHGIGVPPSPVKVEVVVNPDGKARNFGVAEYQTREDMETAIRDWNYQPFPSTQVYLRPLSCMVFPCMVGHCCSLKIARQAK